jgi:hypothetical protein
LTEALATSVEILGFSQQAMSMLKKGVDVKDIKAKFAELYKDYNLSTDRKIAKRMFQIIKERLAENELPTAYKEVIANYENIDCVIIAGDVFKVLETVEEKPEVIVVDPPRVGISNDALDKIIGYGVDQIVYISCNPKTLVNNLYYMQYYGYRVKSIKPFDNFPGTKHTEAVALLEKVK